MAATSKSKVQSAQIILNHEKMSPSKMVYVIPNMSVFHSFEFDKDKIYARHLSIENEKRLLSSVSISSFITPLCNNNRYDEVDDDEENEINEENDLSTTLKRDTKEN
jgi:hypothetical protein